MANSKIPTGKIIFGILLSASAGVFILSFLIFYIVSKGPQIISIPFLWWSLDFSFPIWSGLVLTSLGAIILGFVLVKFTKALFSGMLTGFFLGLFLCVVFFSWDLGIFLFTGINRFILENLPHIHGEIYISSFILILLTTISGLLGGLLAKLYQKIFEK